MKGNWTGREIRGMRGRDSGMEVQVKEFTTDALMQEVLENRIKNTARVLKCCAEIEKQAKESGDSRGMGFSYYYEGETYYVLNETEKMFRKMAEAISYLEESMHVSPRKSYLRIWTSSSKLTRTSSLSCNIITK